MNVLIAFTLSIYWVFAAEPVVKLKSVSPEKFSIENEINVGIKASAAHATHLPLKVKGAGFSLEVPSKWYAWVLNKSDGGTNLYIVPSLNLSEQNSFSVFLQPQEVDKPPQSIEKIKASFQSKHSSKVWDEEIHGRKWVVREWKNQLDGRTKFIMKSPAAMGMYVATGECLEKELNGCRAAILHAFKSLRLE